MEGLPAHTNPGSLLSCQKHTRFRQCFDLYEFGDYAIKYLQSQIFYSRSELSIVDNLVSILSFPRRGAGAV